MNQYFLFPINLKLPLGCSLAHTSIRHAKNMILFQGEGDDAFRRESDCEFAS